MDRKKVIYLAGAISATSHWEFLRNIRTALEVGRKLMKLGYSVYIPHLDFLLFLDSNENDIPTRDEIYLNSFEIMKRCDEIWVLPNSENSKGVKKEIEWWMENGKADKVFYLGERVKENEKEYCLN